MDDNVKNPAHYTSGEIQCIDAIRAALTPEEFRGYCKGNIMKYVWREKHKGGKESLEKAAWYLARLIGENAVEGGGVAGESVDAGGSINQSESHPDWSDAPEWANWLAQDEDGSWFWFEYEPKRNINDWWCDSGTFRRYMDGLNNPDWQSTLQQRPSAK